MLDFIPCVELDQLLKLMNSTHRWVTCDQIVDAVMTRCSDESTGTFLRNKQDLKIQTELQLNYLADMGLLATDETHPADKLYKIADTWYNAVCYYDYVADSTIKAKKPTRDANK